MNSQTGEILAMATTPGFDNNNLTPDPNYHRIRAITDQFEPGQHIRLFRQSLLFMMIR